MTEPTNGGRVMRRGVLVLGIINVMVLLTVLAILVGLVVYVRQLNEMPPLNVISAENPQSVTEKQVPANGAVHVTATKCNLTDHILTVDSVSYLVQESPFRQRWQRQNTTGAVWQPGCRTNVFENHLRLGVPESETLDPGIYHIEGTNTVREGNRRQDVPWFTQSFEVIE